MVWSDGDSPALARTARAGADFDMATGKAEDAHAGRVFAPRDVVVPARAPERQDHGGIGDTRAVIRDDKPALPVGLGNIEIDDRRAGSARILDEPGCRPACC
jgi:hypothetical protein